MHQMDSQAEGFHTALIIVSVYSALKLLWENAAEIHIGICILKGDCEYVCERVCVCMCVIPHCGNVVWDGGFIYLFDNCTF